MRAQTCARGRTKSALLAPTHRGDVRCVAPKPPAVPADIHHYFSLRYTGRAGTSPGARDGRQAMRVSVMGQAAFGEAVLKRLVADNPTQLKRVSKVESLVRAKLAEMDSTGSAKFLGDFADAR